MTSRRHMLERASTDELAGIIGCALEDRIAGSSPNADVWGRIMEWVERTTVRGRVGMMLGLLPVNPGRVPTRSRMDAFLSAQVASLAWPDRSPEWRCGRGYTRLVDQYGVMLQLAC